MLQVATERLSRLWPDATIDVLTYEPGAIKGLCPATTPLVADGRSLWLKPDFLPGKLGRLVPKHWSGLIRRRAPRLVSFFWRVKFRRKPELRSAIDGFTRSLNDSDLVLVSGMGGITDCFPQFALDLLESLNLALSKRSRPVVMVGQGFGPLDNSELRARAADILPRLDLIAIRERRVGPSLLATFGVDPNRIIVTGDDGVELAYGMRRAELGVGVGVNLRLSDYSGVGVEALNCLRRAFAALSKFLDAPLIPVPVSHVRHEADVNSILRLIPLDEAELKRAQAIRTPRALVRQIQRCRVVVTGSYHAGVFALANGIPTVCLARSEYYIDKFLGLGDMFGIGCDTVMLDRPDHADQVDAAVLRLWDAAPVMRPKILASAEAQVAAGHAAYRRIHDIVMRQR